MAKKGVKKRLKCRECKKHISQKLGAYVLIGTYNRPSKPDDEGYYHFPCFADWFSDKVKERAFGLIGNQSQLNITSLINNPELKKLAESIIKMPSDSKSKKKKNGKAKKKRSRKKV